MDYEASSFHVRPFSRPKVLSFDNREVYYSSWESTLPNAPNLVLVFVHGARENSQLYSYVAEKLAGSFSYIYALDLRGHSVADKNNLNRTGKLENRKALIEDLIALMREVKNTHPNCKIILGGHSLGSAIVLNFVTYINRRISEDANLCDINPDALILTSPALRLNFSGCVSALRKSGGILQLLRSPSVVPAGSLDDFTSRSVRYQGFRKTDALQSLGKDYLKVMVELVAFWRMRFAKNIVQPSLIIAGSNDNLISYQGAVKLHASLKNVKRRRLLVVDGAYHTVFFDDESEKVFQTIQDWTADLGTNEEATPHVIQREFCVYRNDFWVRTINRLQLSSLSLFFWYLVLFIGLKIFLTTISGTLASPSITSDWYRDAGVWTLQWLQDFFKMVSSTNMLAWTEDSTATAYYASQNFKNLSAVPMPFLRDYIDILVTILFAGRMTLLHSHWDRLSVLPDNLWANNVVNKKIFSQQVRHALLRRYDIMVNSKSDKIKAFVASGLLIGFIYGWVAFIEGGIYPSLISSASSLEIVEWQRSVFQGWWANPVQHPLSFFAQMSINWFVLYYSWRSNQVGALLIRLLNEVKARPAGFAPCPDHADGLAGLRPVKKLINSVFMSLGHMVMAVTLLLFFLPYNLGFWVLLPGLIVLLVISPLIVIRTLEGFQGVLSQYKEERLSWLSNQAEQIAKELERQSVDLKQNDLAIKCAQLDAYRFGISRLERMPTEIYSRKGALLVLITYIIPIVALILQFVK